MPKENEIARAKIERDIEEYLKAGKKIDVIPTGMSGENIKMRISDKSQYRTTYVSGNSVQFNRRIGKGR